MEDPFAPTRLHIKAADITLHRCRRGRTHHHRVAHHEWRGVQTDHTLVGIHLLVVILAQVDGAADAEIGIGDAGPGIKREHGVAAGDIDHPLLGPIGPVTYAKTRTAAGADTLTFVMGVYPQKLAGACIQAHHIATEARGDIDAPVRNQRGRLVIGIQARAQCVGGEFPGQFELIEVGGIDLVQWRITGAGEIVGVMQPVGLARARLGAGRTCAQ